ncbi:hypothetical protein K469DRAFT_559118 [Zopfia rhizophila CBS 207.26]|uniref:Integral membrane protein-like protein n=1 Tax=Zopfia rhizophila CBS 207.26 TaxID=1314779 RepID=A0A6A6EKQ8_9PEZI|nr:hypothetical protein K469DRAFT_559118 [Zopfia rhizophila CBS 207.26]
MPSDLISQTVQGALLSVASNVLAQVITSYKENTPFSLNLTPILKFALFSVLSNPPNILWQNFLEDLFPTHVQTRKSEKASGRPSNETKSHMNMTNVLIKFILDQTVGAVFNTLMFIVFMGYINAPSAEKQSPWAAVGREIKDKFYPMIMDGYKVWPIFSLVSFLWIPVDKRIVAGCAVGIGWGVYLSMMADA